MDYLKISVEAGHLSLRLGYVSEGNATPTHQADIQSAADRFKELPEAEFARPDEEKLFAILTSSRSLALLTGKIPNRKIEDVDKLLTTLTASLAKVATSATAPNAETKKQADELKTIFTALRESARAACYTITYTEDNPFGLHAIARAG